MKPVGKIQADPRLSFPVFLAVVAATFLTGESSVAMTILLVYIMFLFSAAGAVSAVPRHLIRLAPVAVLIVLLNGVLAGGTPLLPGTPAARLTEQGLEKGFFFALRFLVLYFSVVLFVGVTGPEKIARAVYGTIRPFSRGAAASAAFYVFNVFSFLPLFTEEIGRIRLAQSFRGAGFGGGLAGRLAAVRLLVVPLLVSAIYRSGQLAATVELRGLRDRLGEALPASRPARGEYAVAVATVVVLIVLKMVLRFASG